MSDLAFAFAPRRRFPPASKWATRATPASPIVLPLGRLLIHLDLTPTLTLMERIELRGTRRWPRVRGKGIAVAEVLRVARRCTTLEEVMEGQPSLDELDVRACLAYDLKVRAFRGQ